MSTDWDRYQKCPVCFAPLGKPCKDLSGGVAFESYAVDVERDRPHSGRRLRAAAARDEQSGRTLGTGNGRG